MSNPTLQPVPPRIFLSYARNDDETFVRRLYDDLRQAGFIVWFDREALLSRGLSFHQEIKDAIRTEVDRVVYVGGPKAVSSAYVREEWQFALACDHVVVVPILRLGGRENIPGSLSQLQTEDFRNDETYALSLARLSAHLRLPKPKLGGLFGVPSLPPSFLDRPELMSRVRDALLVDLQKPQVITGADARVGIQGMGGIGKSVLAVALARNRQIRESYPDGIVWISCGQNSDRDGLVQRQRDLAKHLGGDADFDSLPQGQGVLRKLLSAKAVLLVLDDVWHAADAQAFDVLGPRCRMLVTTRDAGILHALQGERVSVSLFTDSEALQLLADTVGIERAALSPEAKRVVAECGCLPLAVALSGGMAAAGHSWKDIVEALCEADLEWAENRAGVNEQHRTIWNAMKASVDVLAPDEQQRFAELAVFDFDSPVPEAAAYVLWQHTGQLSERNCTKLLINLSERSLIQLDPQRNDGDPSQRRFRLHDLLHDYAVRVAGEPMALHRKLVAAYFRHCRDGWHIGPNDGYFFEHLANHVVAINAWPEAEALLTDFSWLMRKCELGLLDSIGRDYQLLGPPMPIDIIERLEVWREFFREKAHILRRGNAEWPAHKILLQLAVEVAHDSPVTRSAEEWLGDNRCDWIWMRLNRRPLKGEGSSGDLVLECHKELSGALQLANGQILSWGRMETTPRLWDSNAGKPIAVPKSRSRGGIEGVLQLANGSILYWKDKGNLEIWDLGSGRFLALLDGHTMRVCGALQLADGRILSWSDDHSLRLWDASTGSSLALLEGHGIWVSRALQLADGRILSWSVFEKTLRLWDPNTGKLIAVLAGHSGDVTGALQLGDGRILSWSREDNALRLWDSGTGGPIATLEGHTGGVDGASQLADGRIISWSSDNALRLWDSGTGGPIATLEGHTGFINGVSQLADGRILSWSSDNALRLWDSGTGGPIVALEGHTSSVVGAFQLADGRILSRSFLEKILRLWDPNTGRLLAVLAGHSGDVTGALQLGDGRILSWSSADRTLRLCDPNLTKRRAVLEGHTDRVDGALQLADGRVLSWSWDHTLRLWDPATGGPIAILEGHTSRVEGALQLGDGHILSWSNDKTLRLWDPGTGGPVAILEGHTSAVSGALQLSDGHILSWCDDKTLRLWDPHTGDQFEVLEGHLGDVCGAFQCADGRILSWSNSGSSLDEDNSLRLWDPYTGRQLVFGDFGSKRVFGAFQLADGRIFSWFHDQTIRLWDPQSGLCLEVVDDEQAFISHPAWLQSPPHSKRYCRFRTWTNWRGLLVGHESDWSTYLARWDAGSIIASHLILPDGTAVVTQRTGQVCFPQLHFGNRRITLEELEKIIILPHGRTASSNETS
jgi:WD40 repeat protein